ncbi:MAG TPA: hypothetical protein PLU39_04125 [Armatimonadota bacterium]|nr:hypothetical protein [Armatimonadota bacterium]HOJ21630.1 hypothetical protein [Armatimonadota bacterium]HOM83366.1 hypothetical protein [Armatimonadota bacterium]HPO71200.1 hypothetical protein [Armatimonadota bacterium]HPT97034.1 hypothetical protein [Armatimonadota bacterium]
MTPIDEAVGVLRGLASQTNRVEPHCIELRTDPEEGTYLSVEYLCGDLALWVQVQVEEGGQIDENGKVWFTAQLEPISLPQPLGINRLMNLSQRLQTIWPSLRADVSVRNRGNEECLVEGEWYGDLGPGKDHSLFAAVAAILHEMDAAALSLKEALLDAERMQQVEERVAGLLLGVQHTSPRRRSPAHSKRRRGQRR